MRLCDVNMEACSEKLAVFLSLRFCGGRGEMVKKKPKMLSPFQSGCPKLKHFSSLFCHVTII